MRYSKYKNQDEFSLPSRRWPDQIIQKAPIWCSVDLRDGNQALIKPMGLERKLLLYKTLLELGFKQIEVAFPAASEKEQQFIRHLVENHLVPNDVTLQVIMPLIQKHIETTFRTMQGAKRVNFHFYNSNSPFARRYIFKRDEKALLDFISQHVKMIKERSQSFDGEYLSFQYTPEHFNLTDMELICKIAERIINLIQPSSKNPLIFNLPSSMEVSSPNKFADRVEYFCRHFKSEKHIIISVHPHNDRGCALAAAELALLAGAERVEGTLFGNGERAGNIDLVVLALNLLAMGVDPQLQIQKFMESKNILEYCMQYKLSPRHPYVGDLAFAAFSGTHQDAIRKGLLAFGQGHSSTWDVPYLLLDPRDLNLSLDDVIRINSQSGYAGIQHLISIHFGTKNIALLTKEHAKAWLQEIEKIEETATQAEIHDYILKEFEKLL